VSRLPEPAAGPPEPGALAAEPGAGLGASGTVQQVSLPAEPGSGPAEPGSGDAGSGPRGASLGSLAADALAACARDAIAVLTAWSPPDPAQAVLRERMLAFVTEHGPSAADRDLRVGHLTGSALLLDHTRTRVLLTLHPLIGAWVQLGGHVEPGDASMAQAAAREALEESGISGISLDPVPLGIDWHPVRCKDSRGGRNPSEHLDLTWLAIAPPGAQHVRSDESLDLAWFPLDALPAQTDATLHRLVAAALGRR
jgi:8-oxo-dGTP pyrophosphatase MutT (NUDIX family)